MGSILATSNISKTRFLRLYIFCIVLCVAFLPLQVYTLGQNVAGARMAYSWGAVHDPAQWNEIIMIPSTGRVLPFPYFCLGGGFFIFIFFGLGKDAVAMYRAGLLAVGFERLFPILQAGYTPRHSVSGTITSFGSKAKLMFQRKSSHASWMTESTASRSTSRTDRASPKTAAVMETVDEHQRSSGRWGLMQAKSTKDTEKASMGQTHPSFLSRTASTFRQTRPVAHNDHELFTAGGLRGAVQASVAAPGATPSMKVTVCKEVKQVSQASEPAKPAPVTPFRAT